jgi:hypothetical protein
MQPAVLGSWKEIAQFLGKGVRTVQRWEHELQLPVHRPSGARKGVVIAFPEELQKWAKHQANSGNPEIRHEQVSRMHESSRLLVERTEALRKNLQRVQEQCLKAQTWAAKARTDFLARTETMKSFRVAAEIGDGRGQPKPASTG